MTKSTTESCPIGTDQAGKADGCEGCPGQKYCSTGQKPPEDPDIATIASNIKEIKNIIVVLSGKGGVGKSLTSMMLARSFAEDEECEVGLLDIDICGPSVPTMTKQLNATENFDLTNSTNLFTNVLELIRVSGEHVQAQFWNNTSCL